MNNSGLRYPTAFPSIQSELNIRTSGQVTRWSRTEGIRKKPNFPGKTTSDVYVPSGMPFHEFVEQFVGLLVADRS